MDESRTKRRLRITRGGVFLGLFTLPFVVAGVGLLVSSLRAGQIPSALFGLLFTGLSLSFAWRALAPKAPILAGSHVAGTQAAMMKLGNAGAGAGYRATAGTSSAAQLYESVLGTAPLPTVVRRPGSDRSVELTAPRRQGVPFQIGFAIVWNAFVLPFFGAALWQGMRGEPVALLAAAFLSIFVLAGTLIWLPLAKRWLANRKLPRVEIDAEPAFLGDVVHVRVVHPPGCRLTTLRVALVCREIVSFTEGTNTRTEQHELARIPVLEDFAVSADEPTHRGQATLPADGPHSFASANNQIEWSLHVHADVPSWPDYNEHFALRALPRLEAP